MEILKVTTTKDVSLGGTDFKGAANIVNGNIELLELELNTKKGVQEISLTSIEQIRSLTHELKQLLSLVDAEVEEVDYESAD